MVRGIFKGRDSNLPDILQKAHNLPVSQGETIINLLLLVVIFLLYELAKQLNYLTGKKIKIFTFNLQDKIFLPSRKSKKKPIEPPQLQKFVS